MEGKWNRSGIGEERMMKGENRKLKACLDFVHPERYLPDAMPVYISNTEIKTERKLCF